MTDEQLDAAYDRVRRELMAACFGHHKVKLAVPEKRPIPEPRSGPGPMDSSDAHELDCLPSPSSKQPRYRSPDGVMLSRTEINRNYRARQREVPCRAMRDKVGVQERCGKPSWGGGLCEACYKLRRKRLAPHIPAAQPQAMEAQP